MSTYAAILVLPMTLVSLHVRCTLDFSKNHPDATELGGHTQVNLGVLFLPFLELNSTQSPRTGFLALSTGGALARALVRTPAVPWAGCCSEQSPGACASAPGTSTFTRRVAKQ